MPNLNELRIVGHLGRDPEIKSSANGKLYCKFSVAVENHNKETTWFKVTCFDKKAEFAGEFLHKGSAVMVVGPVSVSTWEKDGKTNFSLDVMAWNIMNIGGKSQERKQEQFDEPNSTDDIPF